MSNSLDPVQARYSVWPDLGPACLQKQNLAAGRQRDKYQSS